ncbi:MAG: GNAT family N-acetyltransferase [Ardenticatenaceae bacterium]|nr:GNAT family N-acetyltransferase [Ardenticatenaceae bacterium]
MERVEINEVTGAMLALLAEGAPVGVPVGIRRTAVLANKLPGKILTDDPQRPSWVVIWEAGDGTVYWGGTLTAEILAAVVARLRQGNEVLIPFWTRDDPIVAILPPEPDFEGAAMDFMVRDTAVDLDEILAQLPEGLTIRAADLALFERTFWRDDNVRLAGSAEAYLATARAFYLLQGEEILGEAAAGPLIDGVRELGVLTYEPYRGRGYATLMCARLIREMEMVGERPFWNCSTRNLASAAVARKLGFGQERVFEFVWYEGVESGD